MVPWYLCCSTYLERGQEELRVKLKTSGLNSRATQEGKAKKCSSESEEGEKRKSSSAALKLYHERERERERDGGNRETFHVVHKGRVCTWSGRATEEWDY